MGYRQVIIKKSEKIHFKDNQLVIEKEGNTSKVPLEDINYVLIEDSSTVITTRLLAEFGKNAISLIVCDEKFEPTSIMYSYNYHFKQLDVFSHQLEVDESTKKEFWNQIVHKKIENSIKVLEMTTCEDFPIKKLNEYLTEIIDGDSKNREGLSAKLYFRSLFESDFIRFYDDKINDFEGDDLKNRLKDNALYFNRVDEIQIMVTQYLQVQLSEIFRFLVLIHILEFIINLK